MKSNVYWYHQRHPFGFIPKQLNIIKMYSVNKLALLLAAIATFSFLSCEKEDPVIPIEEEIITSLTYTLSPSAGGDDVILTFQDLDGDGGNDPVITGGSLIANTNYIGNLTLLNETETPAGDITAEINELKEEHQFFFETSNGLELSVSYNDLDVNGKPVGLSTVLTSGNASTGQFTITLRHLPNKSANGVPMGDISNAGGETDIEVTFDITIQ
jgi:hypothetical protein